MKTRKLFEFPVVWTCECGSYNRELVNWVGISDGQGMVCSCIACDKPMDINIEVNVREYKGGKVDKRV